MAYVGAPFVHDIFISHAHGDDREGNPLLLPWSQAFAAELETELRVDRRYRESLSVFFDTKLRRGEGIDPMEGLTPQLEAQVRGSAILVVLMSPDYLDSKWCPREREWWAGGQKELGFPTDDRVAVVRILPTTEPWPPLLCEPPGEPLLGFLFFHDESGVARPLGWAELPGALGPAFKKALLGIVGRLSTRLDSVRARVEALRLAQEGATKLQEAQGQSIYLHGRADPGKRWEQTARTLTDSGFAVFPGEPDPPASAPEALLTLREQRVEVLSNCDALLLLPNDDGRSLDVDLVTVGRHDRESARARSRRSLLPCGVLDTVGPSVATDVRRRTAKNLKTDWLDGTREPWTDRIRTWLAAKGAEAERLG